MITISEKAVAELKRTIAEVKESQQSEELYVRVAIKGGGCSGYQNVLCLDENKTEKDTVYEIEGLLFVIDRASSLYLEGTRLDFVEDLNKMGFKFENPAAKGVCGCGSSFTV